MSACAAAVLLVAAGVAAIVPLQYYAITPGSGLSVEGLIEVPRAVSHAHLGEVMLTDVELVPIHALSYLYYELDHEAQVVPSSALIGPVSSAQYDRQGEIDMVNARQAATEVALRELGYGTRAVPDGVIVYQTVAGGPGARGLAIGDVVVSVDGHDVSTIAGLVARLGEYRPGASIVLGVRGLLTHTSASIHVHLGEVRVSGAGSSASDVCAPAGEDVLLPPLEVHGAASACLAVDPEQAYRLVDLPFPIHISSDGIIGPSAGLAFTLGVLERLDRGDLAAGLKVAATGTMSVTGQVGEVGGVAQKTIAVRQAGASLFLVPSGEVATAEAHAGPGLKVEGVSTIAQAVSDLEQLGGQLVTTRTSR